MLNHGFKITKHNFNLVCHHDKPGNVRPLCSSRVARTRTNSHILRGFIQTLTKCSKLSPKSLEKEARMAPKHAHKYSPAPSPKSPVPSPKSFKEEAKMAPNQAKIFRVCTPLLCLLVSCHDLKNLKLEPSKSGPAQC